MKKKVIALALGCTVAFGCAVGGTLAWLTDNTGAVTNTFTPSNISIELTETDTDSTQEGEQYNYKMVPGATIAKDPKVTVKANSEDCWLFIHVEEKEGSWSGLTDSGSKDIDVWKSLLTYGVISGDKGWTEVPDHDGYYYRTVSTSDEEQNFYILTGDGPNANGQVKVSDTVDKQMMDKLYETDAVYPTLTFTAAAIQYANLDYPEGATTDADKVATAWKQLPADFTKTSAN